MENIHLNIDGTLQVGDTVQKHQYLLVITFDTATEEEMIDTIRKINDSVVVKIDGGEDIVIRFDGFDRLRAIEQDAIKERHEH
jgi:glycerol-3-phosphate O-acyltransferase